MSKLQIPGTEIYSSPFDAPILAKAEFTGSAPSTGLPKINSTDLIPPIAQAFYDNTSPSNPLNLYIVAFIGTKYNLHLHSSFKYYFNLSLNYDCTYKLTVYVAFDELDKKNDDYKFYSYKIKFMPSSLKSANGTVITFDKVGSVEVFLVNVDPETSRGTVTTVQPPLGEAVSEG